MLGTTSVSSTDTLSRQSLCLLIPPPKYLLDSPWSLPRFPTSPACILDSFYLCPNHPVFPSASVSSLYNASLNMPCPKLKTLKTQFRCNHLFEDALRFYYGSCIALIRDSLAFELFAYFLGLLLSSWPNTVNTGYMWLLITCNMAGSH